jgi:hypothetical protein
MTGKIIPENRINFTCEELKQLQNRLTVDDLQQNPSGLRARIAAAFAADKQTFTPHRSAPATVDGVGCALESAPRLQANPFEWRIMYPFVTSKALIKRAELWRAVVVLFLSRAVPHATVFSSLKRDRLSRIS